MNNRCAICGANLDLVGRSHRCVPKADGGGLRITSKNVQQTDGQIGDGVALTSMEHPPGLIEAMADAIMTGKLSLKRKRAPNGTFDRTAYQREYMRRRRQKEQKA